MYLTSLVCAALSMLAVSGEVQKISARASSDGVPTNGKHLPGRKGVDPSWVEQKQMYGPNSISPKDIKFFPTGQKKGDECSTNIVFDISRCTGGTQRYAPYVQGFDEKSRSNYKITQMVKSTEGDFYDKFKIGIKGQFQGRVFGTDSPEPEAVDRTGLRGFRLFVSESQSCVWLESQPDEETGQTRSTIAPWTYAFYSNTPTKYRGAIDNSNIGGWESRVCTREAHNDLTLQIC